MSGTDDAFVAQMSASGGLVYSTYLGVGASEGGNAIAVDSSGNAYVAGSTSSANFPVVNAYQATQQGGTIDAYVSKLSNSGASLLYSTYLGGSRATDKAFGIAVDNSGYAYVTGQTYSRNFPTTTGSVQTAIGGGEWDGFVTKLNTNAAAGTPPVYSAFIGGSARDEGDAITLDSERNAYITGYTNSSNFPIANAYQTTCNACGSGVYDAFVMKLNATGSQRIYSTYLGGSGSEYGRGIAVDWSGTAYITGRTQSTNFPVTWGAFQVTSADGTDAFIAKLYDVSANAPQANECYGGANPVIFTTQPSGCGGPVNTASGNFWLSYTDIAIPGRGVPLNFTRTYNSLMAAIPGTLGYGWTHNYNMYIDRDASNNYLVHQENGSVATFASDFSRAPRVLATLSFANNTYTFTRIQGQVRFDFESVGEPNVFRLRRIVDRNGYTTLLTYANGLLQTVTEPDGRTLTFNHVNERLNSVRDNTGARTVVFGHDTSGDLRTVDDVGSQLTRYTYQNHLLHTITDANNGVVTNTYDATGRLLTQTDAINRPPLRLEYLTNSTRITDTLNLVTVHEYEANRLKRVVRHPNALPSDQAITRYGYRAGTNYVSSVTDPLNHTTSYTWDDRGNLLSAADALQHTTSYSYTSANDVDIVTDPDGYTTDYDYDTSGNLTKVTRKLVTQTGTTDVSTSYEYSGRPGDVTADIDPRLKRWSYSYDVYGYPDVFRNPPPFDTERTDYDYDNTGRLRAVTDPKNNVTRYDYNPYDQLTKITDALTHTTDYTYDNVGNLTNVTDPNRNTITNTYNLNNELERVTQPDGTYTIYGHDNAGRVTSVDNPLRKVTGYLYEDVLRRVTVTDPLTRQTKYNYDLAGRLANTVDAQNRSTIYGYYDDDQLERIDYEDPNTSDLSFTYNSRGLRATMYDATGTTIYGYDSLGRTTFVDRRNERIDNTASRVDYGYDLAGNITTVQYPARPGAVRLSVTRTFDAANRMEALTNTTGIVSRFSYDANSNLTGIDYLEDRDAGVDVRTEILYDRLNLADVITHTQRAISNILFSVDYGRDYKGLVHTADEYADGGYDNHFYDYDAQDRLKIDNFTGLTQSDNVDSSWDYFADSQIERSTTTRYGQTPVLTSREYDGAGQIRVLTEVQGQQTTKGLSFDHSATGTRKWKVDSVNGQRNDYAYDQANQLTSYNYGHANQTDYVYGGDGLRQYKCAGPTCYEHFAWDIIGADGVPLLLQDDYSHYIYGPGGMLLSMYNDQGNGTSPGQSGQSKSGSESGGAKAAPAEPAGPAGPAGTESIDDFYYLLDQQGSVRAIFNEGGGVLAWYSYDAYGTQTVDGTGLEPYNPFGYVGQYKDQESGLLYMRARHYDPTTQQFLSRDPAEAASGQPYAYAWSNPVNYSDPTGSIGWPSSMFMQVPNGGEDEAAGWVGRAAKGGGGPASSPGSMQGASTARGTASGIIKYGDLDELGRPTGVQGTITRNMPKGSSAQVDPEGWVKGGGGILDRAHLWAKRFGGSGYTKRNLAIVLKHVNQGIMDHYEDQIAGAVTSGELVWYRVTPIYMGRAHYPYAITLQATGSRGFHLDVSILNR